MISKNTKKLEQLLVTSTTDEIYEAFIKVHVLQTLPPIRKFIARYLSIQESYFPKETERIIKALHGQYDEESTNIS